MKSSELLPDPRNWRTHPTAQADALRGVLAEIGFADAVLARETPDGLMLIDGHLRAESAPDAEIPVQCRKLLIEFGLTPAARSRMRIQEQQKPSGKWSGLLSVVA